MALDIFCWLLTNASDKIQTLYHGLKSLLSGGLKEWSRTHSNRVCKFPGPPQTCCIFRWEAQQPGCSQAPRVMGIHTGSRTVLCGIWLSSFPIPLQSKVLLWDSLTMPRSFLLQVLTQSASAAWNTYPTSLLIPLLRCFLWPLSCRFLPPA